MGTAFAERPPEERSDAPTQIPRKLWSLREGGIFVGLVQSFDQLAEDRRRPIAGKSAGNRPGSTTKRWLTDSGSERISCAG